MNGRLALAAVLLLGGVPACARGPYSGSHTPGDATAAAPGTADPAADPSGAGAEAGAISTAPIVLRNLAAGTQPVETDSRRRRRVEEDASFWEEKLGVARAAAAAGEDREALDLLTAALRLHPPEPWDGRLKSLRMEIKARHVETAVLRVDARGAKDYVVFGEDVTVVVRLRNVGDEDVTIEAPAGTGTEATSGAALSLTIERRDVDVYAAEMSRTWTQTVPIVTEGTGSLRIPPEGEHEVVATIPAEDAGGTIAGLHVLTVSGSLRAGRIEAGLGEPLGRIPVRAARVLVLPGNYEPLAADPLGSIRKAVAGGAPVHLLVAAHFVAPEARAGALAALAGALTDGPTALGAAALNAIRAIREAAVGTPLRPLAAPLMDALGKRPAREADLMEGLVALTGLPIAPDARLWQDWWRREAAGATVAAEDAAAPVRSGRGPARPR